MPTPSQRYLEHTAPELVQQRQRIVLAIEPEKSALERELVQHSVQQHFWDLSVTPQSPRVQRMLATHCQLIAQYVKPDYIAGLTSTWIRAANTAALAQQALAQHYAIGPIMPCRLLDASQYRDLSLLPDYLARYGSYVAAHGKPPEDPAFLQGSITLGSSTYHTWLNGKRFIARLLRQPLATLRSWGHTVASDVRTLLIIAYSHKEVWEQMVTDAHPQCSYLFDGSLGPGEIMFLVPQDAPYVHMHLPESELPIAMVSQTYFDHDPGQQT
jgi:hypothetical protein